MDLRRLANSAGRTIAGAVDGMRASGPGRVVARVYDGFKQWGRLERAIAVLCFFTPLLLWVFDGRTIRDSISAYYDMDAGAAFYVPLTIAAMMFVVNGVLKHAHWYNRVLGVLLLGVVVFDHDAFTPIHVACAGGFFAGNALVILFSRTTWTVKAAILGFAAVLLGVFVAIDELRLYWIEWASLLVVAVHYTLDSLEGDWYRAPAPASDAG